MRSFKKLLQADITSVLLPILFLIFSLSITSKGFLSAYNLHSSMQLIPMYVMIGLSQMIVLSLGQMNLALGSMGCLSGIVMGLFMQVLGVPIWISIAIGLVVASLLGMIQGLLVTKTGINPFIITLSLLSIYKGIASAVTKGQAFQNLPDAFRQINRIKIFNMPVTFLVSIVFCGIIFLTIKYSIFGRKLLACGENSKAAVFSGINYNKTVIMGHTLSGFLAGVAAVIQITRFGSAQLSVGNDWMLPSFVVAILGGTLLSGGKVSVIGTFFGSILMVLISNALVLWGVSSYAVQAFIGIILIMAYEIDRARTKMVSKEAKSNAI